MLICNDIKNNLCFITTHTIKRGYQIHWTHCIMPYKSKRDILISNYNADNNVENRIMTRSRKHANNIIYFISNQNDLL